MANQYDADAKQARKQRLAVAHMAAEEELETRTADLPRESLYAPALVSAIHAALYLRLPAAERVTDEGDEPLLPGAWRSRQVAAGRHVAPKPEEVEGLLVAFAAFFLETCLDQARFMSGKLDLAGLRDRLADLLTWLAAHPWQLGSEKSVIKPDALEALHYVAMAGPVERARFMVMTGLPERTARRLLASLLDWGLLTSPSTRAPVNFAVPLASLRFLFPRLWPEAEVDAE